MSVVLFLGMTFCIPWYLLQRSWWLKKPRKRFPQTPAPQSHKNRRRSASTKTKNNVRRSNYGQLSTWNRWLEWYTCDTWDTWIDIRLFRCFLDWFYWSLDHTSCFLLCLGHLDSKTVRFSQQKTQNCQQRSKKQSKKQSLGEKLLPKTEETIIAPISRESAIWIIDFATRWSSDLDFEVLGSAARFHLLTCHRMVLGGNQKKW